MKIEVISLKLVFCFIVLIFLSCSTNSGRPQISKIVDEYYSVYKERDDFQKFLNFYDEEVILEDIISGDKIVRKKSLSNFFDWENPSFIKIDTATLVISDQIIQDTKVVTKGYFTKFKWNETTFEAMHFTTILIFNESGKNRQTS